MVIASVDGQRYLVSTLGEKVAGVENVRADGGQAVPRHGRREEIRLEEVPVAQRAPILKACLRRAPGERPYTRRKGRGAFGVREDCGRRPGVPDSQQREHTLVRFPVTRPFSRTVCRFFFTLAG